MFVIVYEIENNRHNYRSEPKRRRENYKTVSYNDENTANIYYQA